MIIAPRNVISIAPLSRDTWEVTFRPTPEADTAVCPVVGWATVVAATNEEGVVQTAVLPAFVWGGQVWTEHDLAEHSPEFTAYDLRPPSNIFA